MSLLFMNLEAKRLPLKCPLSKKQNLSFWVLIILTKLGFEPPCIEIKEDFASEAQWSWFEAILSHIQEGDILTVDLTHGYRAISIIFSAAITFLQKAKNIKVNGVLYAALEK